ncbi:hypothetical protein BGZ57DRAFT_857705 [Hyaloscypha finlandica]|nr:hypothetical protein BGZ57DRAFT_857705 [Hyaloscypha finlandica]
MAPPFNRIPPPPPLPASPLSRRSTAPEIQHWIQRWQFHRVIAVPLTTLSLITWTGSHLLDRSVKKLSSDLVSWGFHPTEAQVLVADILEAVGRVDDLRNWNSYWWVEPVYTWIVGIANLVGVAGLMWWWTRTS